MLNSCNTIFIHEFVYFTALILLFNFCQRISHNFKNQEQTNFDLVLQHLFLCWFFSEDFKTEYNYVNVLSNISTSLFLIVQSNLTYHFSPKSQQVIGTNREIFTQVLARLFSRQVPVLSKRCTFVFGHPTGWEIHSHY